MKNRYYNFALGFLSLTFCGCNVASTGPIAPAPSSSQTTPTPDVVSAKNHNDEFKYADDLLSESENLSYGNYQIERLRKPTIHEGKKYDEDGHQYAVLKQKGKVVAQFDDIVNPLGTNIRFGLYSLLGGDRKQLIVEQTTHRGWGYWVVDLDQNAKVIHNSATGGFRVLDIDGDGKAEVIQSLLMFWFFERLDNTNSPFPDIVFTYDSKSKKYVPANYRFQDFVLQDVEEHIVKVKTAKSQSNVTKNDGDILAPVLEVLLRYIYAGKEKEAWEFYESEYNLPDKAVMKSKIKERLKEDSIYQTISKSNR